MIKKIILIYSGLFMILLFLNCSTRSILKKDNRLHIINKIIEKEKVDTIFLYNSSNLFFLWFHKDNKLHSYMMKDNKLKKYRPVKANFINVEEMNINKYINGLEDNCFSNKELDGESISIYLKNKEMKVIGFDLRCLTKTKFDRNSFPYKLQYDFSKIFVPEGYSFDQMYIDEK